ncbi:MAG TPA: hypothetical protein PL048_04785 [Leptospiraceae bacterium]|nr:hypothetical protein [Leptospiraceae bacterium]HMY67955.1 hypothetical protein [Leptospiraceae bacterium]HMZ58064.1 hypothetical protein [Leptospiraceae bacterium]HNF13485.1 hypothetical protein [Leptospiraceae bacterium]HNF27782.1 hypothetical protein [Leptospiraceae bacterium]
MRLAKVALIENYYEEISQNFTIYGLKIDLKRIEEISSGRKSDI